MLSNQISPSDTQLAELQSYPQNTPLVMLNILKFKEQTNTNETGQEAYARYFKNASPFVENSGAKLIWKGQVHSTVIGNSDNQPHIVFLIEYPTELTSRSCSPPSIPSGTNTSSTTEPSKASRFV